MKKSPMICLLLVLVLLASTAIPAMAQTDAERFASGCVSLQAQKPLAGGEKLLDTAKAVILYEMNSNTMVYSYRPDAQIDPSGMNKIMTALLALELGDPEAIVTVSRNALDSVPIGSVSANLKRDEQVRLIDLIYCMMVGSANDAAAVIAEYVGQTQETFVAMMNQRAMELGCKNTNFANANGIKAEGQYSTARDLAVMTAAALQNETFAQVFSTVTYTVNKTNKSEVRELQTSNNMMRPANKDYFDERITGGKTGALSTTDRSLICTAQKEGTRFLSIVMSASGTVTADPNIVDKFGSYEETLQLINFGFEHYNVFSLLRADQVVDRFRVDGGDCLVSACPRDALKVALPQDALISDVTYQCSMLSGLTAPLIKGQQVGSVQVWYDGICIGESDLVAMHDVYIPGTNNTVLQPSAKEKIERNWTSVLLIGGAVAVLLIALGGVVLLVLRLRSGHRYSKLFRQRQKQRSA